MTIVLIYGRASSDPTDQHISVDRQIKLCTARAEQLWPEAQVQAYRDDSVSAADPGVYRPGFAAFLAAVRSARRGELVGVVVNEQSRLTRQGTGAWDDLVITLTRAGLTEVQTLRSGPVSVAPGNRLVGRILAVVDAEEVERTKARVQAAHEELFREGRPSSRAPFGYRSARDEQGRPALEPDPITSIIVRQVFDMALAGHSIQAIVDRLNEQDVPPSSATWKFHDGRTVTRWRPVTVRVLLTSPSVAGLRGHTDPDGRLHTVPAKWPALVDPGAWEQVQRILARPSVVIGTNGESFRVRTQPAPKPRYWLLSGGRRRGVDGRPGEVYGVLRCGRCGFPLVAQTQGRRDGSRVGGYQCTGKLDPAACGGCSITPAEQIDQMVVEAIQHRLASSPSLRKRLEVAVDDQTRRWRAERDQARARMTEASEMFGRGEIDLGSFRSIHGSAKGVLEVAQARLDSLPSDVTLPSIEDVYDRWDGLTLVAQRAVVGRLIDRIEVEPGRVSGRSGLDRIGPPVWLA